ncbi:probably inactive leucine-rich repeat receptor-like protein kinase At3g28040 [Carica papaya]|uniref:probably inactive leucine-rich repeat receptor-like protein kinase At3g28040 n=1 Tax=Carica papaya TaxID=3649 RepID=UPI000B8C84D4|nr:probably inactive leucine-rich repeat receptor-like protein kinase At3g28040 [Carica papaya]
MRSWLTVANWVVMLLLIQLHGGLCCWEEERLGLLDIKAFVKSNGVDAIDLLPSWLDDDHSDCCNWERVTCNSTTDRVTQLWLDNLNEEYVYSDIWFLNFSIFLPFKHLMSLNLSHNNLFGSIEGEELSALENLEELDLSRNHFNGSLLPQDPLSFSRFRKLKQLDLSHNHFGKEIFRYLNHLLLHLYP